MCYTTKQKNLIGAMIGSTIMGRSMPPELRASLNRAYADLEAETLTARDLRLIQGALELITPQSCQSCSKEGYRDMIEALNATRRMLSEVEAVTT